MALVTQQFVDTWYDGTFVGEHTPKAVVQVQLGHWVRGWYTQSEHATPPVSADIWGEGGYATTDAQVGHWSAKWVPNSPFYDVPNIASVKRTKDLSGAKGVQVVEIVVDALDYVPKIGALGDAYHALRPGWLAPGRGYTSPQRGQQPWQMAADESPWSPVGGDPLISDSVAIRVWQGLGDPQTDVDLNCPPYDGGDNGAWVFRGMIDDVDVDGDPNQITITARNGKLLTDQRVFRAAKSVQLKDPITFYDRLAASRSAPVAHAAKASSDDGTHAPANVLDRPRDDWNPTSEAYQSYWLSGANIDSTHLEWVEIKLEQGTYSDFWMAAQDGQVAYVGLYVRSPVHYRVDDNNPDNLVEYTDRPLMDGQPISEGWVNFAGDTPSVNGGWPYMFAFHTGTSIPTAPSAANVRLDNPQFNHVFEIGRHSILRIGFMRPSGAAAPARAAALFGMRRYGVQRDIRQQQFILVDDATEIVKVALRWAGYTEWEVEDAYVRLSDGTDYGPGVVAKASGRLSFNRANYLVDIIDELAKQLGWVFFIADPTNMDSEGVPTFRRDASLVINNNYIAADLNEKTMLTGLKVKHTDENRPYVIRVRGKTATARGGGVPLGGDSIRRLMAVYFPPWAFGSRAGGMLRFIVYQDDQIITYAQCMYGALLIAQNAALAMHTAVAEIPGCPLVELDDQVSVTDEATATNSRLWVVKTEDTMQLGENASWKMTVEGSLLDTRDLQDVIAQVLGQAPISYGVGTHTHTLTAIDWRHVTNPNTGHVSGYIGPAVHAKRPSRIR